MNPQDPPTPIEPVATGDRRGDVRLAPDGDQQVRAEFLSRPDGPPPPQGQTESVERDELPTRGPPVEDIRTAPASPSVWDARPADDGTPKDQ